MGELQVYGGYALYTLRLLGETRLFVWGSELFLTKNIIE